MTPLKTKIIKAVLFDYGGVIAEEGFANGLAAMARNQNLNISNMPAEGMKAVYDSGFVLGHGTEADFWQLLRQRTGLQGDDAQLTEYILQGFILRDWMIEQVRNLKAQGYITGILSDQTHWINELDQRQPFMHEFDHIYVSYNLGKGKHDPSLFSDVANNLGLATEDILFIDDNKNNTQRAQTTGMQTITYVTRESFVSTLTERLTL